MILVILYIGQRAVQNTVKKEKSVRHTQDISIWPEPFEDFSPSIDKFRSREKEINSLP